MNKYYATYKNIGKSDIAVFNSEKARDEWVNFQDSFSRACGLNHDNATFQRMALDKVKVERLMHKHKNVLPVKDEFDATLSWYLLSLVV